MLRRTQSRLVIGVMAGALLLLLAVQVEAREVGTLEGTEAVQASPSTAEPPAVAPEVEPYGSCLEAAAEASAGPLAEARSASEPSIGEETHALQCPLKGNPCQYTSQCNHTYPECQYCICLRGGCYCYTWAGH